MLDKKLGQLKEKGGAFRKEIQERTMGYVVGALGLTAGLAWNEAIKALIEYLFPLSKNNLVAKFIYASIITLVVVVISVYLVKLFDRKEKAEK